MRRTDSMSADSFSSQLHGTAQQRTQRMGAVHRSAWVQCIAVQCSCGLDAPDCALAQWTHRKRTVMERVVVSHSTLVWPVSFFTSLELHRRVLI